MSSQLWPCPFRLLSQNTTGRVAYKQQKCISLVSGGWEFEIGVLAQLSEASLLSCGFLVSLLGRRANDLPGAYFISTNPIRYECL